MKRFAYLFLAFLLLASQAFAYFPITRIRNFVNDKNNGVPITASYMDAELNQLVLAANNTALVQSSSPVTPTNGMLWFDTTNNILKVFRNNEFVQMNPVHAGAVMTTPQNNDLWVNNTGGQDHLKIYDINTVNWNDIPVVPNLNGTNWQTAIFNGTNWQDLVINRGINWNTVSPTLFNGTNWDDPSYLPLSNRLWTYQSFGNVPKWTTVTIPNTFKFVGSTPMSSVTNSGDIAITNTNQYFVRIIITAMSGSDSIGLRINNDTGSTSYGYYVRSNDFAGTASNLNSNFGATKILLQGTASTATTNQNMYIDFYIDPQSLTGGQYLYIRGTSWGLSAPNNALCDFAGGWTAASPASATSFRLITSGGSVTMTGTVYLYQIQQS